METMFLSQKCANTRSPKGLRDSVVFAESQPTPATLNCADVLAFLHTNLPIFAGVSTAFVFLASGAISVASAINTSSHLLMLSSIFASFISSVSSIILIVHAAVLLYSHTSPICGLSSSCTGRTMHEVQNCCCRQM